MKTHTKVLYSLLASTALLSMPAAQSAAEAATLERTIVVAQATTVPDVDKKVDEPRTEKSDAHKDKVKKAAKAKPDAKIKASVKAEPAAAESGTDMKKAQQDKNDKKDADDKRPQKRDMTDDQKTPAAAAPKSGSAERKAPAAPSPAQPQATQAAPAATPAPAASAQPDSKAAATAAAPPPTKARDASEFIRRDGQQPARGMSDVRKERHETKDGNRVVIQEGNRTIEREGNRTIIRHNEADRFAVGARDVKVDRRGNDTVSIILRPNGIRIVSTTDEHGNLLRRVRRDRNGHDVVIIDNGVAGARRGDYFVDVRPPRVRGHNDRYIVDAGRARPDLIYQVLLAAPVEALDRRYTVDQVRYSHPLREYMPRVDLDINFATGSWQLSPDQVGELSVIAKGINRAIDKNPREVFLIEGHTDAVGDKDDNLSLSDRRAEAVAIALTEQFQVPPENLLTQGYGEENLKVATDGPSRENRFVAVRRITPLIAQSTTEGNGGKH
jgi:outer membrane protein OmpA-like peptidoglycan-associated protein